MGKTHCHVVVHVCRVICHVTAKNRQFCYINPTKQKHHQTVNTNQLT